MQTQPATTRMLIRELASFIGESLKDYPFPSPTGLCMDCRVYLHGMPEDQDDGVYPFVVVRWLEGEIESMDDSKTVLRDTVGLLLGVHAPRSQAEAGILCAELLDVTRRALWKKRILARRFELMEPLRASIPGIKQQVHRFHMATLETVWNYVWPPKALEEAGQSQITMRNQRLTAYSESELEQYNIT